MKGMSEEHNVKHDVMTSYCKNLEAVIISENLLQVSRKKHFDIHHHSIRKFTEEKTVTYDHVITRE